MLTLTSRNPLKSKAEMLVILVCDTKPLYENKALADLVKKAFSFKEFTGKAGEELVFADPPDANSRRIVFRGLGTLGKVRPENLRRAAGAMVKKAVEWNIGNMTFAVPDARILKMDVAILLTAMIEGARLANYVFETYLEKKKKKKVERIYLATERELVKDHGDLVERVNRICDACLLARTWVSMPANDKTPMVFAGILKNLFAETTVTCRIYPEEDLLAMKFGAMLSVAKGSLNKPALVVMDHNPKNLKDKGKTVVLVGKGVTFDSGGLDLKTAEGMVTMKMDMAGAAAVAAAVYALSGLVQDTRIVGIASLVENMPSGDALRPGDIVRSYSGKSIEIGNTDAEGRLILADALSWAADTFQPDLMIDLATLTGACMVALGDKIAGLFTKDLALARAMQISGEKSGDECWPMPMPEDYKDLLKSDFADIRNMSSGKWGGAITAALFLSEFVRETRWAHLDIAGPAYSAKGSDICPPGGTGFGVRLLCELISGKTSLALS
ncbi:MAG: leucyl aminopeptidase [Proteobacteria bacterium]|nr:leucyl aminopeptidase [Pseudomonadota bacterium]